jgi:hypothetical protein
VSGIRVGVTGPLPSRRAPWSGRPLALQCASFVPLMLRMLFVCWTIRYQQEIRVRPSLPIHSSERLPGALLPEWRGTSPRVARSRTRRGRPGRCPGRPRPCLCGCVLVFGLHDLGGDFADGGLVRTGVVSAEHEVSTAGQDDTDLGLSTAAVAAVSRRRRRRGGRGRHGRRHGVPFGLSVTLMQLPTSGPRSPFSPPRTRDDSLSGSGKPLVAPPRTPERRSVRDRSRRADDPGQPNGPHPGGAGRSRDA